MENTTRKALRGLAICGVLVATSYSALSPIAMADEQFFGTRTPSVDDFVAGLKPQSQLRMRGIKPATTASEPPAVSMQLRFAFDSAQLTSESKQSLDNLSSALTSPDLTPFTFMIEGHTDAVGSESYNLTLSEQRAQSVVEYLTQKHGVDAQRLRMIGKGEASLLNKSNPTADENRRVAVVNMGESTLGGF